MMIISTINSDPDMPIAISTVSRKPVVHDARISETKTLDGGVDISHFGVYVGDKEINIDGIFDKITAEKLKTLFENELLITVATGEGVFTAVIKSFLDLDGHVTATISIKEAI